MNKFYIAISFSSVLYEIFTHFISHADNCWDSDWKHWCVYSSVTLIGYSTKIVTLMIDWRSDKGGMLDGNRTVLIFVKDIGQKYFCNEGSMFSNASLWFITIPHVCMNQFCWGLGKVYVDNNIIIKLFYKDSKITNTVLIYFKYATLHVILKVSKSVVSFSLENRITIKGSESYIMIGWLFIIIKFWCTHCRLEYNKLWPFSGT